MGKCRDQFAISDSVTNYPNSKVNRALYETSMSSNRKRRLANKADDKLDNKLSPHNRLDYRSSASLICSCSPVKCSTSNCSVDNRPVNLRSSVQCNSPVENCSSFCPRSFGNQNSTSSLIRSSFSNRTNPEPSTAFSSSDGLACLNNRQSSPQSSVHPPIQRNYNTSNHYSSSLRSPPAKRRKTSQLPLQSPESSSPPARLDNKRNEKSLRELFSRCVKANCGRSTGESTSSALPSALQAGDKENNSNNFRDHENDIRFKKRDKVDHQSSSRHDKVSSHKSEVSRNASDSIRKNDDSNLEADSNAVNDDHTVSAADDLLQPKNSNQPERTRQQPAEQPAVVSSETNCGCDLADRQRDEREDAQLRMLHEDANDDTASRTRRFLTASGALDDVEYWRLKCIGLTKELRRALDELDGLENENELLRLELSELRRQSKVSGKLKKLLQMLGL